MNKKTALVTGASKGIGKEIARLLRENGYEVCTPTHQELDLADVEAVEQFVAKYKETGFDVIVNNAGINDIHNVDEITDDEIRRTMVINFEAPLRLIRGLVPAMKERRYGRIVNIGSIWGIVSKPGRTMYSATKHAIHGITSTLAVELAPYNILINTVCPGYTLTELTRKNNTPKQIAAISENIPLRRMAQPEEIAHAVLFLANECNTYITGQQIAVDGGFTSI